MAAARAAWQPYRDAIGEIEDDLRTELRPAMSKANHDATHAGFGHQHATARRAAAANGRVADAEARIAVIHAGAPDVEQRLDAVEAQAWNLHNLAHPSPAGVGLEDLYRGQLHETDQLLDALDVWTLWASGRPVAVADLTNAAETFADSARLAPLFADDRGEIERSHWTALLEPVLQLLGQRGVELAHDTLHPERAEPDLGLDL